MVSDIQQTLSSWVQQRSLSQKNCRPSPRKPSTLSSSRQSWAAAWVVWVAGQARLSVHGSSMATASRGPGAGRGTTGQGCVGCRDAGAGAVIGGILPPAGLASTSPTLSPTPPPSLQVLDLGGRLHSWGWLCLLPYCAQDQPSAGSTGGGAACYHAPT